MEQIGAASILINGSNLQRFDPIPWRATPLQKRLAALQLVLQFSFWVRGSRVSGVHPSHGLGPGLPVPESESIRLSPPCQCAPDKLELELEPNTQNTQWQGLVSLRVSTTDLGTTTHSAGGQPGPPTAASIRVIGVERPSTSSLTSLSCVTELLSGYTPGLRAPGLLPPPPPHKP